MNAQQARKNVQAAWLAALVAAAMLQGGEKPPAKGGEEKGGGFGIGPGMVLLEHIRPGGEVDVAATTGFEFDIVNGTAEKQTFTLDAKTARAVVAKWEMGYESFPDASWLRLDKTEIEVGPKSQGKAKLFIKIPDKPENYNRKWMAVVTCAPGKKSSAGGSPIGLVVASRVQIETVAKMDADGANAGDVAFVPSLWMMSDARPGDSWRKVVKVRNNSKEELKFSMKRLDELEKQENKHDRYFGKDFMPLVKESWLSVSEKSFSVKPGEVKELKVTVAVSPKALPGKRYEELLFLQDEKGRIEFVRLRTELAPPK